jgi:alpha-N-arabinofuranosidase
MTANRRRFLQGSAYGLGATLLGNVTAFAGASDSRIDVLLDEPSGVISPDLYGYLLENLGTVIYDGIWVGEHSKIPNLNGIRLAVIERLRDIKASVIRWPGGNFADYYNWEDGIGPRQKRPRRTNQWTDELPPEVPSGPQRYDPNWFGTPEFMQLCQLSGGRPFLSVNVRSMTPQSFYEWVDYCNAPPRATSLSDARSRDGSRDPYGVRYWGIGNEVWAAGGNMTAAEYATLYKRFSAGVPNYGVDTCLVAAGPPPGWNTEWIHEFMRICTGAVFPVRIDALSLHYYATLPFNYLKPRSTVQDLFEDDPDKVALLNATEFATEQWYRTLHASARLRELIDTYWQALGVYDEKRNIKIAVDEWGAIYQRTPTKNPANLTGRGVTLRDAVAASMTMDILNSRSNVLSVANYTGLINQEGGVFQADGAKFCTTPVYHVFKMYSGHQGGQSLRVLFDVPSIGAAETGQSSSIAHLSGSASLRDDVLTLTISNPHASKEHDSRVNIRGAIADRVAVATLTHTDIHAQNTFDNADNVVPKLAQINVNGSSFTYSFPPASVTSFTVKLSRRS